MGQNCSCFFKPMEGKTENLGSRPIVSLQNGNNEIKENNKKNIKNNNQGNIKQLTNNNGIPDEIGTQLNKYVRGYLYRKKFKLQHKQKLIKFTEEIYDTFITSISSNESVNEISSKFHIQSLYEINGWNKYYDVNPLKNDDNSDIQSFQDKIIITYVTQPKTCYDTLEEIFTNMLCLYKGTVDINNTKHGLGKQTFKDGSYYYGNWVHNRFIGWNMSISSKGILYIGNFVDFSLNGKGERYTLENHIYKGDFISNLREGHGIESTDKSIYDGDYKDDKQNGRAKVTFTSGDSYEGEILNAQFHGKGHYKWKKTGHEYIGEYKYGKLHGEGLYRINEEEYYKGEYKDGIKEGKGEMHFTKGKRYVGPFSKGKPHGIGYYDNGHGFRGEVEFIYGRINKSYRPSKSPVKRE